MRTLLSFATPEYRAAQQRLNESARRWFDRLAPRGPTDIPADFIRKHAELFNHRRGWGYWCWKPLLILRELSAMGPDDELFYADSQCVFEADPAPIFPIVRHHRGIGLFHQKREKHKNSTWTHGDCFRLMGCDHKLFRNGDNLATTYSAWTRTEKSLAFVQEWLTWCLNPAVVGDSPDATGNSPDFRDHRHDQSIASLLAIRDGLFTLCACSQFGDGYRCKICKPIPRVLSIQRLVRQPPWCKRPKMSSIVEVSAVASCPMGCQYCPQDTLRAAYSGPEAMTPDLFRRCLDNLVPGDAIHFAGFAEPALNPHLPELAGMALGRGHACRLFTTGRGLTLDTAATLAGMGWEQIVLHLPDEPGSLRHSPATVPILETLARHPKAMVMAMGNLPHPDVMHLWATCKKHFGAMHDRAGHLPHLPHRYHAGPIRCKTGPMMDHPVLLPDGRLALCCCDYGLRHIVGNLAEQPIAEIIAGPALTDIRDRMANGGDVLCRRCINAEAYT